MTAWKDDGEYWTKKLDNKKKKHVIGSISIKKTALNAPKFYSTKHGESTNRGGS